MPKFHSFQMLGNSSFNKIIQTPLGPYKRRPRKSENPFFYQSNKYMQILYINFYVILRKFHLDNDAVEKTHNFPYLESHK